MDVLKTDEFLDDFLAEAREILDEVEGKLLSLPEAPLERRSGDLDIVKRGLHTIKGNSGMMGLAEVQELIHDLEDQSEEMVLEAPDTTPILDGVDRCRKLLGDAEAAAHGEDRAHKGTLRIAADSLDSLVDRLAEMVILEARLEDRLLEARKTLAATGHRQLAEQLEETELGLSKSLKQIRTEVMGLRLVPLGSLFGSLRRIAHDEAEKTGKRVDLISDGGDTPLDKALLEVASQALGHLVRNAIVHGVELPDERRRAGKDEQGRVSLSAQVRGDEVRILVEDDGGGIDDRAVAKLAERQGIDTEDQQGIYSLLFLPGLSTQEEADLGSGRGIGLSAALDAVRGMGGRIEVSSEAGQGTRFQLLLPLTVSTLRALMVRSGDEDYALPLATIVEAKRLGPEELHQISTGSPFPWRDRELAVLDLARAFGAPERAREQAFLIVCEVDQRPKGLVVDMLTEIREIVTGVLDPVLGSPAYFAGSTVLSDGRAILILDPAGLSDPSVLAEAN